MALGQKKRRIATILYMHVNHIPYVGGDHEIRHGHRTMTASHHIHHQINPLSIF